jgi:ParB family chromosome partitioning protein
MTVRDAGELRQIAPDQIRRNPENPRLFFRSDEMASLLSSIQQYGIQVPITVYREGSYYTLIDGERRWQCAYKLNMKQIPALVQPKPSALENLLLMFNIHALREQWDYLTIANKLPAVIELFEKERNKRPNEIELSEATGLTRGQIRRCQFLLDLPETYRDLLLKELELPKTDQQLSEDFFIEMEKALKAVRTRFPTVISDDNIDGVRDTLIRKFRGKVITNVTDFRKLSKIATSVTNPHLQVEEVEAERAIDRIVTENRVGIADVYAQQFEYRYDERRILLNINSIIMFLSANGHEITGELRETLLELRTLIDRALEN